MKAAQIIGPQQFEVVDAPRPSPKDGECLIHLEIVSVCGSDVRTGYRPTLPADRYPLPPGFPGHECAGRIVESRAPGVPEGQRVVVHPHGLTGLAEYLVADPSRFAAVPETGDLAYWMMTEPPATVLHACRQLGPVLGKRVVILGQGMLGLCWTHFMNRLGAVQVVVTDLDESRLERARRLGATDIVNASTDSIEALAPSLTDGDMFDVVVEAAGELATIGVAPRLTRLGATVVFFGTPEAEQVPLDFRALRKRELRTLCTAPGRGDDVARVMSDMISLVQRGWFDPAPFITHRLPFESIGEAFAMYDAREDGAMKIILSMEQP